MKENFTVEIQVGNESGDELSGKVIKLPIIPRMGDYLDLTYQKDPQNHPNMSTSIVVKVVKVYIIESSKSSIDAHIEVNV